MYYIKFQKNWDRLLSKVNDWNSILEEKSLSPNANYVQAYICSPLRAKLPEDVYANMISARA